MGSPFVTTLAIVSYNNVACVGSCFDESTFPIVVVPPVSEVSFGSQLAAVDAAIKVFDEELESFRADAIDKVLNDSFDKFKRVLSKELKRGTTAPDTGR